MCFWMRFSLIGLSHLNSSLYTALIWFAAIHGMEYLSLSTRFKINMHIVELCANIITDVSNKN